MSQILEKLNKVDPSDNDAVRETISLFFQNITKHTEVNCNIWLRELEKVIIRFPRYCAQHRTTIGHYLTHFLHSPNLYNVIVAAKCAHVMQQIRPSQDKAATAKNCWREQMAVLCHAARVLLPRVAGPQEASTLPECGGFQRGGALAGCPLAGALRDVTAASALLTLRNILIFMQAMLVEVFPVGKPVQPRLVLDVAAEAVRAGAAGGDSGLAVLVAALGVLDALLACGGGHVLPWAGRAAQGALHALRAARAPSPHAAHARGAAYRALAAWAGAGAAPWHAEAAAHVLRDLAPPLPAARGQLTPAPRGRKARRKLAASQLAQSALAAHAPRAEGGAPSRECGECERAVHSALQCAEQLLAAPAAGGTPPPHVQALCSALAAAGHALGAAPAPRALAVLRALGAAPAAAARHALALSAALARHASPQVRAASGRLVRAHALARRAPPAPCAPPPPWPARINRPKEVITISDEPANKRPRLETEQITDNISVSSASVEALDSTDDDNTVNMELESVLTSHDDAAAPSDINDGEDTSERTQSNTVNGDTDPVHRAAQSEQNIIETNIHEAKTQVPLNTSTDQDTLDDDERTVSMEVVYDPNKENKVTILERTDDEHLPSTNDTDDVQITCGQVVNNSQDLNLEINKATEETPQVNGTCNTDSANTVDNNEVIENIEVKINTKEITVDDMLADFVDEPNEETKVEC